MKTIEGLCTVIHSRCGNPLVFVRKDYGVCAIDMDACQVVLPPGNEMQEGGFWCGTCHEPVYKRHVPADGVMKGYPECSMPVRTYTLQYRESDEVVV